MNKKKIVYICLICICIILILILWTMIHFGQRASVPYCLRTVGEAHIIQLSSEQASLAENFVPLRENLISDNLGREIAQPADPNGGIIMMDTSTSLPATKSNEKNYPRYAEAKPTLNGDHQDTNTHANMFSSVGNMINSCFEHNTGNMTIECQNQINGFATTISSGISSITNIKKSDITSGLSTLSSP